MNQMSVIVFITLVCSALYDDVSTPENNVVQMHKLGHIRSATICKIRRPPAVIYTHKSAFQLLNCLYPFGKVLI
jgi:hypothetical protein